MDTANISLATYTKSLLDKTKESLQINLGRNSLGSCYSELMVPNNNLVTKFIF